MFQVTDLSTAKRNNPRQILICPHNFQNQHIHNIYTRSKMAENRENVQSRRINYTERQYSPLAPLLWISISITKTTMNNTRLQLAFFKHIIKQHWEPI